MVEVALLTKRPPVNVFNPDHVFVSPNRVDDEAPQPVHVPTVRVFSRRLVPVAPTNPNHPVEVTLYIVSVVPLAVVKPSHPVEVTFVNTPVEALVAPMVVPLMVPPLMVAFEEVRLMMLPVVPDAVVKPSQVEVAFVAVRL